MTEEIDFLVGGIPRSGTTALAAALNEHPDIYCYASETNLLPFATALGTDGRLPSSVLPVVQSRLTEMLQQTMIDMVDFNLQQGSPAPERRFSRRDITDMCADIVQSGTDSRGATPLYRTAMQTLARRLRAQSQRPIVGEKTPANILALDTLGDEAVAARRPPSLLMTIRQPYGVIQSMRVRASSNSDPYAAPFRGDAAQLAGGYVRYALACARLRARGGRLYRYEQFSHDPRPVVLDILSALNAEDSEHVVAAIAARIEQRDNLGRRADFSDRDQAIIDAVTEPALRALGGARDPASRAHDVALPPGLQVLHGQFDDQTLAPRAVLLLISEAHHQHARLRLWHRFPGMIADGSDTVCWTVTTAEDRVLGTAVVPGGGPAFVDVPIGLDDEDGAPLANGHRLRVLELACSHSFVPMVHAFRHGGPSLDERQLSGRLVGVEFA